MYIGCLLLPLLILFILAFVILSRVASLGGTLVSVCLNYIKQGFLDIYDWLCSPFRPKPQESAFDPDYYCHTQERPKRYSPHDGEYVKFKKK